MSLEPPPFQESSRCDICNCSFNTFRRRHHCRCCGRTLCAEHSSDQMALPQFGLHSLVRVCSNCYNDASRSGKSDGAASVNGVNSVTDSVSRVDINTPSNSDARQSAGVSTPDCKCGMPLCICEVPSNDNVAPVQPKPMPTSTVSTMSKTKKADTAPRSRGSSSYSKSSTGQSANAQKPLADYEVNGEGLREAIKNGDLFAVKKLLGEGVDANYSDKQGLSLLHLAAVFNQTEIAFTLMENGASLDYKNLQGETPLDCAPVTLQFKMKKKMEEIKQSK
ncbi:vacuolar protein sorting-associated protein 27 [Cynara cardunculus var. scolymus]|uniref:vacuolar protein sorting-associated protein 27 n=1 Tax=Cynara cardunculus var. scolymus TaxID=59895 RepID=UPI000D628F2E|nr:vacuolar protein sorting-associated protein 27 [Cynara cardunculus var. scolymus]